MKYRREIDGLRALAVLPVILFHAGFSVVSGGFLGVDVFFVISGYLITGLILEELSHEKFSLRRFYERRARRILPALYFVMLVCIPFASVWMMPPQYASFSTSMISVIFFVSNIVFFRQSGYFAADAGEKPLLHTWSLAVEEQYYIFFPLALMLLWRFGRRSIFISILSVALVSFMLSEYASRYFSSANFFLIPTRAWELLIGALCALIATHASLRFRQPLAALGLALIIGAMLTFDEHMRLPSSYTLVPVLGTALVLLYGTANTWVAQMLSCRPLVGIGLISYSAYLWHQPLFALARLRSEDLLNLSEKTLLIIASLTLAAITWRFVEQPFRTKHYLSYVPNRPALWMGGVAALAIIGIGLYGHATEGGLAKWKQNGQSGQARTYEFFKQAQTYQPHHFYDVDDAGDCVFRISTITPDYASRMVACRKKYGPGIAIIGDSHAVNTYFMLRTHTRERQFLVGISLVACRVHAPMANCFYSALEKLLADNPNLFSDIIYEQSGSYLIGDGSGAHNIEKLPLNTEVPDIEPYMPNIDKVADYLKKLSRYARLTWFGPRMEPQIRERVLVKLGCNYRHTFRPNQVAVYKRLDNTIQQRMRHYGIHYQSHMDLIKLDLSADLMNCTTMYFMDKTHYTIDGEKRFAKRITLEKILGK